MADELLLNGYISQNEMSKRLHFPSILNHDSVNIPHCDFYTSICTQSDNDINRCDGFMSCGQVNNHRIILELLNK